MQLSARGAQKTRNESRKLQMYSKQWLPGDTLRTFYPIFWSEGKPELAVGAIWGHNVSDIKGLGLGTAFIPSTNEFDANANPIGLPDITYQFSLIASAFVKGQKATEEEALNKKNWPTEAAHREALLTLETKYDTKNNMKAVKPIIGRVQYYISTEVISIKYANGVPDKNTIAVTSCPLSNQTIDRIYALMDDPKYAPQEGEDWFEVEWKYPTNPDKGKSAKDATPAGLTSEYRLSVQFPDAYATLLGMSSTVARDSESIQRRATRAVDPAKVRSALMNYSYMNSEYLDCADEETSEQLIKHADLIHDLDLTKVLTNSELIDKITHAVETMNAMAPALIDVPTATIPEVATESTPDVAVPVTEAPINPLPDLSGVTGAPTVQQLMNNDLNAGMLEDSVEEVDLGSI